VIPDVESRIREYCRVEIYRGYDDQHTVDNNISMKDIGTANKLYAMIDRYNSTESRNILESEEIPRHLANLSNTEISTSDTGKWDETIAKIKPIFNAFHSLKGIGLAKTTKILHLKRPELFPILDSYLIKLIASVNMVDVSKTSYSRIGIQGLQTAHRDILANIEVFNKLEETLSDLPISLTTARKYDILCWTQEKWIKRNNLTAPFGKPNLDFREISGRC
jgi:hypothetical protein